MTQPFSGRSILIIEDEVLIGVMLASEIVKAGGTAIGPVRSVADALAAISAQSIHVAVLDAKLADGSAAELPRHLASHGIPFVVVSGYEQTALPAELRSAPFIAKPISLPPLMEAIERLLVAAVGGRPPASSSRKPPS
ncbi:MAG TPA: hypothetical protein VFB13_06990 [Reyranella sp.]|nr:hypothetical protein [Reyranella sp.]